MMNNLQKVVALGISMVFLASLILNSFLKSAATWLPYTEGSSAVIKERAELREKRAIPNWSMSASDFYGWVEELRRLAAYDKSDEMARIYWAHFPIASQLGYDEPDTEED